MKPAVISGIIVLAATGYFGYHGAVVRPRQALERVQQQLREAQQEQDLRAHVAFSLQEFEHQRQRLAQSPDPDWLLQEVGKLVHDAGIEVRALIPQAPQKGAEFTRLAVSLQFTSTYHQLGQFLSRIESAQHSITVEELDVTPERSTSGLAQVRLLLSVLYVPSLMADAEAR